MNVCVNLVDYRRIITGRASLTPPGNPQPGGIVGIEDIIDG